MDEAVLSPDISAAIKGFSAIEIMLGHIGLMTGAWFLYPYRKAGVLFVGIFFMISGYGLTYGYLNKRDYLNYFLPKRMWNVFFPAYIVYLLYGLIELVSNGGKPLSTVIHYVLFEKFFQTTNWFVFEILFFYLLFWILYRFLPAGAANVLLVAITVVLIGGGITRALVIHGMAARCVFHLGLFMHNRKENGIQHCPDIILQKIVCCCCFVQDVFFRFIITETIL